MNDNNSFKEWASILQNCRGFIPNHPRYEEEYLVILRKDNDRFLYELSFDTKNSGTIDLTLLEPAEFGGGIYTLGHYRCEGLFEFVSAKTGSNR